MPLLRRSRTLHIVAFVAVSAMSTVLACGGGGDDGYNSGPTTGGISGSITAGTEAVPGATVALSGTATRTTTTSASGGFSFTALPPGAYTVAVGLPGSFELATGQLGSRSATVVAGQTATISWTAQRTTGGGGGDGGGNVVEVHLTGTVFSPSVIDITVGTTVKWIVDDGTHTVTPNSRTQPGVWEEASLSGGGATFQHTFNTAGQQYQYHCVPHQALGMVGTVRVAP